MKILFAASEVAPFIKTGGLADVAGSLPAALAGAGHEVKVILPLYQGIKDSWREQMEFRGYFNVTLAWRRSYCGIFSLERDGVTYWFVDNEYYFKRQDLYGHFDDAERFAFFSRAVIETPEHLDFSPDVIHCNDWQTALVPVYLMEERYRLHTLANTRSVFTIHNIEYQGRYGKDVIEDVFGLDKSYFRGDLMEHYGDVNLLKGAVTASDFVTTVSPTYAKELRDDFYAHGMASVINIHQGKVQGILNGLDTVLYDPSVDPGLTAPFTPDDLSGKAACKAALQQLMGLNVDPNVPIVACVSRLVSHKGFDMVVDVLDQIMGCDLQLVVLGTGDKAFEEAFREAEARYPGRMAARLQYSPALSTAIYGGADLFLMPSVAEPCGLSQMIAMRYGTLPIVRETGGLKDSVPPYNYVTNEGLGFTFALPTAVDMLGAIYRSMEAYYDQPESFRAMQRRAMTADFTWNKSAQDYLAIYSQVTGLPVEPVTAVAIPQEQVTDVVVKEPAAPPAVQEEAKPAKKAAAKKTTAKKTTAKKASTKKTK